MLPMAQSTMTWCRLPCAFLPILHPIMNRAVKTTARIHERSAPKLPCENHKTPGFRRKSTRFLLKCAHCTKLPKEKSIIELIRNGLFESYYSRTKIVLIEGRGLHNLLCLVPCK